jgi:6-pyruvoyltetrahydropterin/6-carboxytetrahydropterin synthase
MTAEQRQQRGPGLRGPLGRPSPQGKHILKSPFPFSSESFMSHAPAASYRVEISKEAFVFSAAHFITFAGNICERIHGHNYGVRVVVEGPLDENRYVVDFIALRDAILAETGQWDHHVLLPRDHAAITVTSEGEEVTARFEDRRWVFPREDCIILPVINTTAEELARVLAERLIERTADKFGSALSAIEVAVDENNGQWGICRLPWPQS